MNNNIFVITTFEKCCQLTLGSRRSPCFKYSMEEAEEIVKANIGDIWEGCYDYACIEEIEEGLYPIGIERKFYKYNRDINQYEEIPEPEYVKCIATIGGIG